MTNPAGENLEQDATPVPVRYWWLKRLGAAGVVFLLAMLGLRLWWGHVAECGCRRRLRSTGLPASRCSWRTLSIRRFRMRRMGRISCSVPEGGCRGHWNLTTYSWDCATGRSVPPTLRVFLEACRGAPPAGTRGALADCGGLGGCADFAGCRHDDACAGAATCAGEGDLHRGAL